jgi:hypothetical protein
LLGDEIVDAAKAGKVPILVKQPASFPYSTIFNPGNKISFSGPEMCPHTFQSQHFAGWKLVTRLAPLRNRICSLKKCDIFKSLRGA